MHDSVRRFVVEHLPFVTAPVLEVGSADVNGSVRDLCPTPYTGLDIEAASGVDIVYDGVTLPFDDGSFTTVLCLEVLEHCEDPVHLVAEIVRVLAPEGTVLLTARAPGFSYHNPPDRWRFMPGAIGEMFERHGLTAVEEEDAQVPGIFVCAQY